MAKIEKVIGMKHQINQNKSKRRRRKFSGEFKAKVALEALKALETINQLATRFEVHPHQVMQWKQHLLRQAAAAFEGKSPARPEPTLEPELFEQIGRLKMEMEWLKKAWSN